MTIQAQASAVSSSALAQSPKPRLPMDVSGRRAASHTRSWSASARTSRAASCARRAAADRAGDDRRLRRQPHRGARGGGGAARRGAGGDAPGRRRLRRARTRSRARSASSRAALLRSRRCCALMELRTGVEMEAAGLAAERARAGATSGRWKRRCATIDAALKRGEMRSPRISPSTARSPKRPAIRTSCASSNFSGATSFRARACAC